MEEMTIELARKNLALPECHKYGTFELRYFKGFIDGWESREAEIEELVKAGDVLLDSLRFDKSALDRTSACDYWQKVREKTK